MSKEPTWKEIAGLASRVDCLSAGGGLSRALDVADRIRSTFGRTGAIEAPLVDLQVCLSFECRTMQHCGVVPQPGGDDWAYLALLYQKIRNEETAQAPAQRTRRAQSRESNA